MDFTLRFIDTLFDLLSIAIVGRILMSWFRTNPQSALYRFIHDTTEPVMKIARRITPRTGMLDFSPLIALIGVDIIRYLLISLLVGF